MLTTLLRDSSALVNLAVLVLTQLAQVALTPTGTAMTGFSRRASA
ncbi:hypothetical protein ABZY06_16535 [Streptomyces sp. NPDC006540]|jgi:hypothetical protein